MITQEKALGKLARLLATDVIDETGYREAREEVQLALAGARHEMADLYADVEPTGESPANGPDHHGSGCIPPLTPSAGSGAARTCEPPAASHPS